MNENAKKLASVDIYGRHYQVSRGDLTWRPAAYAILVKDEQILLVKHNDKYHLPGGGVELGEDPSDAVLREVKEETGYRATQPVLVDLVSTFFTFEVPDTGELFHYHSLLLYYKCELTGDGPGPVELDEFEKLYGHQFEWVPIKKLDFIVVGTSVDWRGVVKKAMTSESQNTNAA